MFELNRKNSVNNICVMLKMLTICILIHFNGKFLNGECISKNVQL